MNMVASLHVLSCNEAQVFHSFWIPRLHNFWISADRFCGFVLFTTVTPVSASRFR